MVFTDSRAKTVYPPSRSEPLRDIPPIMTSMRDYQRHQKFLGILRDAKWMSDYERFETAVRCVWDGEFSTAMALLGTYPELAKFVHPVTRRTLLYETVINSGGTKEQTAKLIGRLVASHPDRLVSFPAPENGSGPYYRTVLGEAAAQALVFESEVLMSQGFDPRHGDTHGRRCSQITDAENPKSWRSRAKQVALYVTRLFPLIDSDQMELDLAGAISVERLRLEARTAAPDASERAKRHERLAAIFKEAERNRDDADFEAAPPAFVNVSRADILSARRSGKA